MSNEINAIIDAIAANGASTAEVLTDRDALRLDDVSDVSALLRAARQIKRRAYGQVVTYSPKVFLPITHLCRDVCRYCTFAQTPRPGQPVYMSVETAVKTARQGALMGCREALFTLGDRPEARYRAARDALAALGFTSTLDYVAHVAQAVYSATGLLPHINPGVMTREEIEQLRPLSVSMGIMLESVSDRLCERGGPHYGSPDKVPAVRLASIEEAGRQAVPFTSGILIGIGETRRERIESLIALRDLYEQHGHLQEVIVQNFRAKPDTQMAQASEPSLDDLQWTLAVARLILPDSVSLQAPPNLSPNGLEALLDSGINDWGGVSPLTADFVNPEAPWPAVERLRQVTADKGQHLVARLSIYPHYIKNADRWLDPSLHRGVRAMADADGLARDDDWTAGASTPPPTILPALTPTSHNLALTTALDRAVIGKRLDQEQVVALFSARGNEVAAVCQAADALRRDVNGDALTYVVNRNINYTNLCYFNCRFCAFSKGHSQHSLRGPAYDLPIEEIVRRAQEAWDRGATEVCLQGGIHPQYTGETYLEICRSIKSAIPAMHIHAFSPLEIWQGAKTLDLPLNEYLAQLQQAGLSSLPGTAAEILDDEIRAQICPDKIDTATWLQVMREAHDVGLRSTATIMFGHLETSVHWAKHLLRVRDLQEQTGGFTEFVPLPFVHMQAPMHHKGLTRPGPTFREALLMHAVARLCLHPLISNIQASWVKLGETGVEQCLQAGVNDLGGSLMNESITRAAGAEHGQEFTPNAFEALAAKMHRPIRQRTTLYGVVPEERVRQSFAAPDLQVASNTLTRRTTQARRVTVAHVSAD